MVDPVKKVLAYLLYPHGEFMDPRDVDEEMLKIAEEENIIDTYTYWDAVRALQHYRKLIGD